MRSVIVKSIFGLAFLLLFLALVLFLSAGSLNFWQAWVFLAVFSVCTIFVTAYLMKYDRNLLAGRVKAVPTAETQKPQKVISSGPYGVVQHPMYSGGILLLIFMSLALGSWVAIPFSLPLILTVAVRALEEEKFLDINLSGYAAYRQNVHYRLIPYIW